ncbi:hypothetical protein NDU88_004893 [Pleurodeles waltl]|uniref:Uncharacterized protein n=1 Tax=Pleurodeles waltl TaxID=8319 RepID=A0AAV7PDT8_PLEWA|nr:hypothetical protein NDU88_004893 [Pleurodeles waltl]
MQQLRTLEREGRPLSLLPLWPHVRSFALPVCGLRRVAPTGLPAGRGTCRAAGDAPQNGMYETFLLYTVKHHLMGVRSEHFT